MSSGLSSRVKQNARGERILSTPTEGSKGEKWDLWVGDRNGSQRVSTIERQEFSVRKRGKETKQKKISLPRTET